MSELLTVEALQAMIARSRFHQLFAPQVQRVDHDRLELVIAMHMSERLERQPDTAQWHGGAIASVVDIAGCYALALLSAEPLPTINFRTDYLRPGIRTDLVATARVRRAGRTIGVVDVDVTDESQRLVAVGRAAYAMARGFVLQDTSSTS